MATTHINAAADVSNTNAVSNGPGALWENINGTGPSGDGLFIDITPAGNVRVTLGSIAGVSTITALNVALATVLGAAETAVATIYNSSGVQKATGTIVTGPTDHSGDLTTDSTTFSGLSLAASDLPLDLKIATSGGDDFIWGLDVIVTYTAAVVAGGSAGALLALEIL